MTKEEIKWENCPYRNRTYLYPCKPCPSMHGSDPEMDDVLGFPPEERIKYDFVCACRRKALCHGQQKQIYNYDKNIALKLKR